MKYAQYIGILLGALYGFVYRLLCEEPYNEIYDFNIYSISFIWALPIVIAIIPILFARTEILKSKWKQFFFPFLSVLLFFLFVLSSGLEDWLCILIIAFPFLASAGIVGLFISIYLKNKKSNKLYSILILPFLLNPLESFIPNQKQTFIVSSNIIIDAKQTLVWNNLIEVPKIEDEEYNYGFYNYIGVPRPVKSKLELVNGQLFRIGYFTDGLKLYESINDIDSLNFVDFNIHIDKSTLRDLPTDKHLLNSNYFHFESISYQVNSLGENKVKLALKCRYTLNSKLNGYANFWAKRIIKDFEERLLESLKLKIENQGANAKNSYKSTLIQQINK